MPLIPRPVLFASSLALILGVAACGGAPKPEPETAASPAPAVKAEPLVAENAATPAGSPKTVDDVATAIVNAINTNSGADVFALFSPPMAAMRPVENTKAFVTQVHTAFGRLGGKTRTGGSTPTSDGVYRVAAEHGVCMLELHLTAKGEVIGMSVHGAK